MELLTTHIDYFSGTAIFDTMQEAEEFLYDHLAKMPTVEDELTIEKKPRLLGEHYQWSIDSVWKIYGGIRIKNNRVKLGFQLPGEFCRKIEDQNNALKIFRKYCEPTRIDIALDDRKRRITQSGVNKLGNVGHYKGMDSYKYITSKHCQDGDTGGTCQFGNSDKVLRYYNAEIVHGIPADRWELQARNSYAKQITSLLAETSIGENAGAIVTGCMDFVTKGPTWRHEKRYEFWEQLRNETNGIISLSPLSEDQSLDKMMRWLNRQVTPSLSVLYFGLGRTQYLKLMENLATTKHDKLNQNQLDWINYLQRAGEKLA